MAQRNILTFLKRRDADPPCCHLRRRWLVDRDLRRGIVVFYPEKTDVSLEQLQSEDTKAQAAVLSGLIRVATFADHFERQHNTLRTQNFVLSPIGECAEMLRSYLFKMYICQSSYLTCRRD